MIIVQEEPLILNKSTESPKQPEIDSRQSKIEDRVYMYTVVFYAIALGIGIKVLINRGSGFLGYLLVIFVLAPAVGAIGGIIGYKTFKDK